MGLTLALLVSCCFTLSASAAVVQPEPTEPATTITPTGQLELARLVDLAASRAGVDIEYDSASLKGTATLRVSEGLSDTELWDLMNRVLASRGFTTVLQPTGTLNNLSVPGSRGSRPSMSVVKVADAAAAVAVSGLEAGDGATVQESERRFAPGFVAQVVRVRHRSPRTLLEPVRLVLSKQGASVAVLGDAAGRSAITGDPKPAAAEGTTAEAGNENTAAGGLLLITDLTPRVRQAEQVIALLDIPAAGVLVEEIPAKYLTGTQLAALVKQVAETRRKAGGGATTGEVLALPDGSGVLLVAPRDEAEQWRALIARLDQREPASTVSYTPRSFSAKEVARLIEQAVRGVTSTGGAAPTGADDRWRLVVDELTGTLIVTATASQHEQIAALLARLDETPASARRPVRTFVIRNRSVREVLSVLQQLASAGVLDAGGEDTAVPAGGRAVDQRSDRPVSVGGTPVTTGPQPGPSAGPLLGSRPSSPAAPPAAPGGRDLTLTADEGTNTIIAVGPSRQLDQIEQLLPTLDVRQPQVMVEVMLVSLTDARSRDLGLEFEKLDSVGDAQIRLSSLFGLSTSGTVDGQRVRQVGDAQGFTGIVLTPGEFSIVIRALENLSEGKALSMPKLLVNNNQQAAFTSVLQQPFTSTNASTTVATTSFGGTQDAGTTISIRPQIAAGDHLLLDYQIALSSFVGSGSAGLPPPRQQNSVQSVADLPDGHTVVVGGLELNTESDSVGQVPFIGDVPLLGELFKNRSETNSRSRFFVFIRAGVLRSRGLEDLKHISAQDMKRAELPADAPVLEPRVIR